MGFWAGGGPGRGRPEAVSRIAVRACMCRRPRPWPPRHPRLATTANQGSAISAAPPPCATTGRSSRCAQSRYVHAAERPLDPHVSEGDRALHRLRSRSRTTTNPTTSTSPASARRVYGSASRIRGYRGCGRCSPCRLYGDGLRVCTGRRRGVHHGARRHQQVHRPSARHATRRCLVHTVHALGGPRSQNSGPLAEHTRLSESMLQPLSRLDVPILLPYPSIRA